MSTEVVSAEDRRHDLQIGLLLLSLDAMWAHADRVGLSSADANRVKQAIRGAHKWWADPRSNRAGTAEQVVRGVAGALADAGAGHDAPRVLAWLERFATTLEFQSWADDWASRLRKLTPDAISVLGSMGLSSAGASALGSLPDEYRRRAAAAEAVAEQIEADATSAWDSEQFAQYRTESELISPADYLSGWLHTETVLTVLGEATERLTPAEQRLFQAWARAEFDTAPDVVERRLSLAPVEAHRARHPALNLPR